ncbi:alpha/beta hydrolase [Neorhizobium sp. DAR64860/K0K1]|uniref:alpha/beta hydrolase n=1 Tax=Neorhizobium sp. DAR64860/K0K1 TaxID=3421955 RepID=UPI003D2AFEC3
MDLYRGNCRMSQQPQTARHLGVTTTDTLIPGKTDGIELFLRNKSPANRDVIGSVLLVHGATFPSVSLFDVDVGGQSLMDALALAGIDAWALDVRGYGGSTRPQRMAEDPGTEAPLVRAVEAVDDVASALDHIRTNHGPVRLGLLGMSWGASIAGLYASRQARLDALVLAAPLWLSATPLRFDPGAPIATHRNVEVASYRQAWLAPVPEDRRATFLPDGWFDRWEEVTEATDSQAPHGFIRAPSGAVADVREHWTAGKPLYDPSTITASTLILRGTLDVDVRRDMALDLFDRLTGTSERVYNEIADSTHMLLMEPTRQLAFKQIVGFLTKVFAEPSH